jgi:hypothetical protein
MADKLSLKQLQQARLAAYCARKIEQARKRAGNEVVKVITKGNKVYQITKGDIAAWEMKKHLEVKYGAILSECLRGTKKAIPDEDDE